MNDHYHEYKTDEVYEIKDVGKSYVIQGDAADIETDKTIMINGVLYEVIRKERSLYDDNKHVIVIRKIEGERK